MTRCVKLSGIDSVIDLGPYIHCACQRVGNSYPMCKNALMLEEQGKKVCLTPRSHEEAKALVLDGCVFLDDDTKCDAMYLLSGQGKKIIALVEFKGASDIPHAFEQLAYTRRHRPEYANLKQRLDDSSLGKLHEKAFVVSNGMLTKPEKERLEKSVGFLVSAVLHSVPSGKVPDLKDWM